MHFTGLMVRETKVTPRGAFPPGVPGSRPAPPPSSHTRPLHASDFYRGYYVGFERPHLQHIFLDYTHLDYKTSKCILHPELSRE